jgi:uncharacterized membrane protein YedE/YeeE
MPAIVSLLVGLLFGAGLCLSGMIYPTKVLGFLDLAGDWDPSLAFVMLAAIPVAFVAFQTLGGRNKSLIGGPLRLPSAGEIDAPLIGGSALFGIGWGLAGLCPAPALVDLGFLDIKAAIFVASMAAGMVLFSWRDNPAAPSAPKTEPSSAE